jgi:hypothetical protein
MHWWDLESLRGVDFEPYRPPDGKPVMALAEQAYVAVAAALAAGGRSALSLSESPAHDQAAIAAFLPRLEALAQQYPRYEYPWLYVGKLYLLLGQPARALGPLQQFLLKKPGEYWAWQYVGEALEAEDPDQALACYAQAVSLPGDLSYRVKVMERLAVLLHQRGQRAEARTMYDQLIGLRIAQGWPLPARLQSLSSAAWYRDTAPLPDNRALYQAQRPVAEALLYARAEHGQGVITHIDTQHGTVAYRVSRELAGRFPRRLADWAVACGDFVELDLRTDTGPDGQVRAKVFRVRQTDAVPTAVVQACRGKLQLTTQPDGRRFGFVGRQVYVPGYMIPDQAMSGDWVSGWSVQAFDKVKNTWGWQAVRLQRELPADDLEA